MWTSSYPLFCYWLHPMSAYLWFFPGYGKIFGSRFREKIKYLKLGCCYKRNEDESGQMRLTETLTSRKWDHNLLHIHSGSEKFLEGKRKVMGPSHTHTVHLTFIFPSNYVCLMHQVQKSSFRHVLCSCFSGLINVRIILLCFMILSDTTDSWSTGKNRTILSHFSLV